MSRGADRERQVKGVLEVNGWVVVRSAGSKVFDLLAVGYGHDPFEVVQSPLPQIMLVEVKSTAQSPYERFGPKERQALRSLAAKCGGKEVLAYWPPHGRLTWIHPSRWPLAVAT